MRAGDLEKVQNYVSGDLNISNESLTSLEGCPEKINNGAFDCSENELTSFKYFPKYIKGICFISDNKFTSFKNIDQHIEHIGYSLWSIKMNITSGYSDLFGIDGLQEIGIDDKEIQEIVNRYLPTKDLINFQDEMIKSGYESYL